MFKKSISKLYEHFMHDSLRRNSSLLILSQAISAGVGFIFWVICARLFSSHSLGLATSFVAFGSLIATFANLGLATTLIRFLHGSKAKGGLIATSVALVGI